MTFIQIQRKYSSVPTTINKNTRNWNEAEYQSYFEIDKIRQFNYNYNLQNEINMLQVLQAHTKKTQNWKNTTG